MNRKDIQELAELRQRVAALEKAEALAMEAVARVFGIALASTDSGTVDPEQLRSIVANAEAIRDALAPFDSGTRAPRVVAPVPDVARAYGVPVTHPHAGIYSGPEFREVWGKGVPYHWRNRGEPYWRQGNVEPTFHAAKEYRFSGGAPAELPPTAGES